ncbi:MAG: TonB-dependent receptor, partial [Acidobacteria bacterium]|nr:TonB-dependent receptor [Acidobacteriota bacterium]
MDSSIGVYGTRNFLPTVQDDTRYQINDGISIQRGNHSLKFGGDYNYLTTYQSFGFNQFGYFVFTNTDLNVVLKTLSTGPGQNRFDNSSVQYRRQIGNLLADFHMHQLAFYAQDTWRLTPNFQLTYGLRWEGQVNPSAEGTNAKVVQDIQNAALPLMGGGKYDPTVLRNNLKQWMPRLGFTWSPGTSSKTVIRGNTGLFYAATPMVQYGGSVGNFRATPGDVSLTLTGTPTVYTMFKNVGIDLNTVTLDKLPIIPLSTVYAAAASVTGTQPNPFNQAGFTGLANDYQNPRAFQGGLGVDQELSSKFTAGVQLNYINTVHLQRNRDYNLPVPTVRAGDGRPIFVRANRPMPQYSALTLRESTARSLYRGMTLNTRYRAKRYQFGAYYTLSDTHSDDDNERSSGGFAYDNPYNMRNEYGYSDLDVRHQFTSYGVVTLPLGIEFSATARFFSGRPVDPAAGSDLNGDASSTDRPYKAPGVPFGRNSFRNQGLRFTDVRFMKNFNITERVRLQFSTELFNLLNYDNVVINSASSGGNKNYGAGI